jgi:hypothetical protein
MKIKKIAQENVPSKYSREAMGEITDAETERIDFIHNEIIELINTLNPTGKTIDYDINMIQEVADLIEEHLVAKGICTAMEFMPYREE